MFKDYKRVQNLDKKAPKRSILDLQANENTAIKLDIGCFIEELLFLNHEEEADYINRTFIVLYNNRLLIQEKLRKIEIEKSISNDSDLFKPKINETSYLVAETSKHNKISVEDRLLNKQKEYDQRK